MKLPKLTRKKIFIVTAAALTVAVVVLLVPPLLHTAVPLPPGTRISMEPVPADPEAIRLLIDDTAWDESMEQRVIDQEIFDQVLAMIDRADQFVYVDLFLWNPWQGSIPEEHRQLSTELAKALIRKKRAARGIDIIVLTDPINRIYGGHEPEFFKDMAKAGIPIVFTDLDRLPDSNLVYSPYWRQLEKALNSRALGGWAGRPRLSNPFLRGGADISTFQFGLMLLFKANHRKVVITGSTDHGLEMLVGSLNPADGSSAHSNMALAVKGRSAYEALRSELDILRWSTERKANVIVGATNSARFKADSMEKKALRLLERDTTYSGPATLQFLTEGAIADGIVDLLGEAGDKSEIRIAMFYLSQRAVVDAIAAAAKRGATVKLVLDANRDAFGMKKVGIPNRPVAARLMKLARDHDIQVRWADTHGEQFHTKAMSIVHQNPGDTAFITGSANWTRRNIDDLNLEANLVVRNAPGITEAFNSYFDTIWSNSDGLNHTLPYQAWEEKGLKLMLKEGLYRIQERFGAGTF
ncbi:MAG: phospholipase D-like domain-containing protein [bacterium]|nr:phospholipase D-like domain-containing protein [bacterium]